MSAKKGNSDCTFPDELPEDFDWTNKKVVLKAKIILLLSSPRIQLLPKPREKTAGRSEANPEKKAVARGGGHF